MQNSFDVIVVGVGSMGSATCYQLAKRGFRVLGLDQFGIAHSFGSHNGDSRMIRYAYYEDEGYVPLLKQAYHLWCELEEISNQKLYYQTGGIYIGDPEGDFVKKSYQSAQKHNLSHKYLSNSDIKKYYPQFNLPKHYEALYEKRAGFLLPEKIIQAYTRQAILRGAEIHGCEAMRDWSASPDGVEVRTSKATYSADHLVLTCGAWSSRFLKLPETPLKVTRQVMGWVWPKLPELFSDDKFLCWAIGHEDGTLHYGFPLMQDNTGGLGLKVAHHWQANETTVDSVDRTYQEGDEQDFIPVLTRYLPDAAGPVLSTKVCLYTNSKHSHFIIDKHPDSQNVTIACGFSGHGFKFVSVMGKILADLAEQGTTELPIDFLSLKRSSND